MSNWHIKPAMAFLAWALVGACFLSVLFNPFFKSRSMQRISWALLAASIAVGTIAVAIP